MSLLQFAPILPPVVLNGRTTLPVRSMPDALPAVTPTMSDEEVEEDPGESDDAPVDDDEDGEFDSNPEFDDDLGDDEELEDEFADIDEDDFDDGFDDDFEEELDDDYEIEIDDEISDEFGLSTGPPKESEEYEVGDFDDFDDMFR